MTLMNGAVIGSKALLWSDTAHVDQVTGDLVGFGPKIIHGENWPWALSWTTIGFAPISIANRINEVLPRTLPELLESAIAALRDCCEPPEAAGRLLIAAFDRDSPRLFMIASEPLFGLAAFAPIEGLWFLGSHNDCAPAVAMRGKEATVAGMLDVIDTQYRTPGDSLIGPGTLVIDGDCVQVEVSLDGATLEVVREWGGILGQR